MKRKLNSSSDFDFILNLLDADNNPVGWIEANWELTLYTTSKNFAYKASYAYGEKNNCLNDNGKIHVVVDRHEFPIGDLFMDFAVDIPDERFPDGSRHVSVLAQPTDIEMVLERGLEASGLELNLRVPHIGTKQESEQPAPDSDNSEKSEGPPEENA